MGGWGRAAAAALLVVALGSCDGGDGAGNGQASTDIAAVATEFAFEPDTWTVPAGEEITLTFTNEGSVLHEWVLLAPGTTIETEDELSEGLVLFETEAPAGEQRVEAFTAPEAGTYQVICAVPGHFNSGMEGQVTAVQGG